MPIILMKRFLILVTQDTRSNGKDFLSITTDCGREGSVRGFYRKHTQPGRNGSENFTLLLKE